MDLAQVTQLRGNNGPGFKVTVANDVRGAHPTRNVYAVCGHGREDVGNPRLHEPSYLGIGEKSSWFSSMDFR